MKLRTANIAERMLEVVSLLGIVISCVYIVVSLIRFFQ